MIRGQLNELKASENYLQKIKELLQSTNPDIDTIVDLALKQERLQNEKKNQKILEMFQQKDETIAELEKKIEEMEVNLNLILINMIRKITSN